MTMIHTAVKMIAIVTAAMTARKAKIATIGMGEEDVIDLISMMTLVTFIEFE